ncbi:MAG: GFA family protein [Pseudomonadota bacterium]
MSDEACDGRRDDQAKPLSHRLTGRCYSGAIAFSASRLPEVVAYCHCADCRRVTGAPVAAFATFAESDIAFHPHEGQSVDVNPGVVRTFCNTCG